jgi:hypothetical protein
MTRLHAMAAVSLLATIGYGAVLLGSEAADMGHDRSAPGVRASITWSRETETFLDAASAKCGLTASRDCRGVLFVDGLGSVDPGSSRTPGLEFANKPAWPVVNPYSGTFVTFPLR